MYFHVPFPSTVQALINLCTYSRLRGSSEAMVEPGSLGTLKPQGSWYKDLEVACVYLIINTWILTLKYVLPTMVLHSTYLHSLACNYIYVYIHILEYNNTTPYTKNFV